MLIFVVLTLIIFADVLSKQLAKTFLMPIGYFPVLQDVFHLTYLENTGAAFGILPGQRWLFIVLKVLVSIAIVYLLIRLQNENKLFRIGLTFVLGGAVGNLIDRIRFGYVVDMFDFTLINYPVFNIADTSVIVGVILLGYYLIFLGDINFSPTSGKN